MQYTIFWSTLLQEPCLQGLVTLIRAIRFTNSWRGRFAPFQHGLAAYKMLPVLQSCLHLILIIRILQQDEKQFFSRFYAERLECAHHFFFDHGIIPGKMASHRTMKVTVLIVAATRTTVAHMFKRRCNSFCMFAHVITKIIS